MIRSRTIDNLRHQLGADRRRVVGAAMGLGYGAGWAACTVWLRRLMDVYPLHPTGVMFWRGLIVSSLLLCVLLVRGGLRLRRGDIPLLLVFGLVGIALNNASWGWSVSLNGVTVATVMAYSAPVFTVLLSRPLYGERITGRKVGSLALAISGCLLVSQVYDLGQVQWRSFGILMALAVGVTQAGSDLMGKKVGSLYPELTGLFYAFLFGTLFLGLAQASPQLWPELPAQGWLELSLMSAGIMVSYLLYLGALARLPVSVASILGLSEVVVAAGLAYLVHGEMLLPLQVLGVVLVVSGVALLEIKDG